MRLVCFGKLREHYPRYSDLDLRSLVNDPRIKEFKKAREMLDKNGIETKATTKLNTTLGFIADNLTHGLISPVERTLVAGVCFPEKPTLQSMLPLIAIKNLLDSKKADVAYVALPIFAYAGAGLAREDQYLEILGLMRKIYGGDLGERVFIVPDTREEVMAMKYSICNLASRFVSDDPAKQKYPFNNLFGFFETASYGADIIIGALAEGENVTIVSDFRQFESIHAGNKMAKLFGRKIGALFYTLINPKYNSGGRIKEVSDDSFGVNGNDIFFGPPEVSSLFYEGALVASKEEVMDAYDRCRLGKTTEDFSILVKEEKEKILRSSPVPSSYAKSFEDISIKRIIKVKDILRNEMENRVRMSERDLRGGIVYESF